jgi:hypothetical protein
MWGLRQNSNDKPPLDRPADPPLPAIAPMITGKLRIAAIPIGAWVALVVNLPWRA